MKPCDYSVTENEEYVEKLEAFLTDLKLAILNCRSLKRYIPTRRGDVQVEFKRQMAILDDMYAELKATYDKHMVYLESL